MGKISQCRQYRAEILAMNAEGVTRKDIAAKLNLSQRAVQTYLRRGNVAPKYGHGQRPSEIDRDTLARLLSTGCTLQAIAQELGYHWSTIQVQVQKYGLRANRTGPRAASGHRQQWAGGRTMDKHGYILIFVPLHPLSRRTGYVFEHRLLGEVVHGRYLDEKEVLNHKDNCPYHNWPSNLELYADNASHLRAELTAREKTTPRLSIPGAYRCTQRLDQTPSELETLAQCPQEIRAKLQRHIEIHRPTTVHRTQSRLEILRSGAHQPPFQ